MLDHRQVKNSKKLSAVASSELVEYFLCFFLKQYGATNINLKEVVILWNKGSDSFPKCKAINKTIPFSLLLPGGPCKSHETFFYGE